MNRPKSNSVNIVSRNSGIVQPERDFDRHLYLSILISSQRKSQTAIAKKIGVSLPFLCQLMFGIKKSKPTQEKLALELGFTDWKSLIEGQKLLPRLWADLKRRRKA